MEDKDRDVVSPAGNKKEDDSKSKKVAGRKMVPENADANVSIGRPDKLSDINKDLLCKVLDAHGVAPLMPILESLIVAGKPITGFTPQLDREYFIRHFLQIGLTASKPYDRKIALEAAARLCGYYDQDKRSTQEVSITFDLQKPADSETIDAEYFKRS